jgi:hypothetical protein
MSWVKMRRDSGNFLLLRYEDMLENTQLELARVSDFLHLGASSERLAQAVELSSASRMRKLEEKQSDQWVFAKGMRKDIPFIRSAKSGGWQSQLSPGAVSLIETAWGKAMQELGYAPSGSVPDDKHICVP